MKRNRMVRSAVVVLFAALFLMVSSCTSSSDNAGDKVKAGDTKSGSQSTTKGGDSDGKKSGDDEAADPLPDPDLKLADDVVVVKRVKGKTVKGLGNDGASILLDGDNPDVKKLEVGSVLLLTGVGAGRVTQIDELEGDRAITFSSVSLPEVIADGEFNFDETEVDMSQARLISSPDMAEVSGQPVEPAANQLVSADNPDPDGNKISGEAGKFKFEFEWKPSSSGGGNLKVSVEPNSDFQGKIDADIELEPLKVSGGAKTSAGKTDFFDLDFANMTGKAKISADLTALKQTAAITSVPFLKVPVSMSIPFPIAGIPFSITLGATLQLSASIALQQNSIHGEAELTFGGPAQFQYKGGKIELTGNRNATVEDTLKTVRGVANGPAGLVMTYELPKVSFGLKIAQTGAGVFVSNGMVMSLTMLPAPVSCKRVQTASVVAGGIDAEFLGASVTFTRKAFLDKRWTFSVPKDDKRCDGE